MGVVITHSCHGNRYSHGGGPNNTTSIALICSFVFSCLLMFSKLRNCPLLVAILVGNKQTNLHACMYALIFIATLAKIKMQHFLLCFAIYHCTCTQVW